jgi:hypothetical protein
MLPQQTAPNSLGFHSLCAGDSPFALFGKQFEIQLNGLILMLEHMNLMLAAATDADKHHRSDACPNKVG